MSIYLFNLFIYDQSLHSYTTNKCSCSILETSAPIASTTRSSLISGPWWALNRKQLPVWLIAARCATDLYGNIPGHWFWPQEGVVSGCLIKKEHLLWSCSSLMCITQTAKNNIENREWPCVCMCSVAQVWLTALCLCILVVMFEIYFRDYA